LQGKKNKGLAEYLGISPQALSNKLYHGSYTVKDLIRISCYLDAELAFITKDGMKFILDKKDLDGERSE
jgi:hypothetical protein